MGSSIVISHSNNGNPRRQSAAPVTIDVVWPSFGPLGPHAARFKLDFDAQCKLAELLRKLPAKDEDTCSQRFAEFFVPEGMAKGSSGKSLGQRSRGHTCAWRVTCGYAYTWLTDIWIYSHLDNLHLDILTLGSRLTRESHREMCQVSDLLTTYIWIYLHLDHDLPVKVTGRCAK